MPDRIDILEDSLLRRSPKLLDALLKDHTLSPRESENPEVEPGTKPKLKKPESEPEPQRNIFWATHDYESLGAGYEYHSPILPELITGEHGRVLMPRVLKDLRAQRDRSRDMAEVFTPSWICNLQNNLIDEAWFGRKDVFNKENDDHTWEVNPDPITFPEGKTWRDYVRDTRLEITCGEAPYLVSRYDAAAGEEIPLARRIGLLDRKLRVVSENVENSGEWLEWAQAAFKSVYGYEWQGDNLLLARENLLATFEDYYRAKFGKDPILKSLLFIAYIISWNVFQMDGLRGIIPDSCGNKSTGQGDFF